MLERSVAGIVVIGLILWGASILATPDADEEIATQPGRESRGSILPPLDEPASRDDAPARDDEDDDDDRDDEDDRDDPSTDRRRKNKGPD